MKCSEYSVYFPETLSLFKARVERLADRFDSTGALFGSRFIVRTS